MGQGMQHLFAHKIQKHIRALTYTPIFLLSLLAHRNFEFHKIKAATIW